MSNSSNSAIEGKYEVLGKIREGGMGAIYMVRHRLLNEIRIIKVMRPEVAESADQRKRFLREAQMATRLKHGNIVGFYDFFVDDEGTAYMVMEYIDGINLRDMIRNCGALPIGLAIYLARQCLSALDYLHRKGVVHRDVAPDNIMMTQEEDGTLQTKLIDLGIAKLARAEEQEQLTAADEFIGKLRYSSPEQLTKKASSSAIDGRSDLFSFGVVMYEGLTGICPFGGGSLQEILTARLHKPPMPFAQSDPNGRVGAVLRGTILRALQTKPEDRYQTAAEFSKALEGLPAPEASPETPEQVSQYVRNAIDIAKKAAAAANPAGASVQKTLQSKFRVSEISVRPLEATDAQVERTIARWGGDATPTRTGTREGGRSTADEKTLAYAGPKAVTGDLTSHAAHARKASPVMGYVLAAAGAAVLVVVGVVVAMFMGRRSSPQTNLAEPPTARSSVAVSKPTEPPPAAAPASSAPANAAGPTAPPPVAQAVIPAPPPVVEEAKPAPAKKEPKKLDRPISSRPAREPETKIAKAAPAANPPVNANRPKQHFCAEVSRTGYFQGVPKEVPPGFADTAHLPARDDAARIRITISVRPEEPVEGQDFTVVATFSNGGDGSFRIARIEESSPGARGGFQPIAGVSPQPVDEGGKLEIFRTTKALGSGDTYHKKFRVVEQRRGDSWEAEVTVKPCVEQ
ncbi:MAG TPA: serine/threonine-protein kinase [Thermoanaerobaculia bacterium]